MKSLSADIQSMEAAKDHASRRHRAWITNRIGKLNHLLATRTDGSALALRRLTGPITLSPKKARGGQAVVPGPAQDRRPQPAGRGRGFEFIALVEASPAPKARKTKSIPGEWCRGPKGPKQSGGADAREAGK